jgi:type II restriction enzyme
MLSAMALATHGCQSHHMTTIYRSEDVERRAYWIANIQKLSGVFGDDSQRLEIELSSEIKASGFSSLISHLRLCGDIPEQYSHDSSEEKLYSKYTDCLIAETFKALGLQSLVLSERGDAADVEVFTKDYSFVADAKAFRLSRTAKNAKDFKISSMDAWKRGKPYAIVICPIYQLPTRSSQIYSQATTRNVCIGTYSYMSLLVSVANNINLNTSHKIMDTVFQVVETIPPSKDALPYWMAVNRTILNAHPGVKELWINEKKAAVEGLTVAKEIALTFLATERERIMRMSHQEALMELVRIQRIDSRIQTISRVSDNNLMEMV